MGPGNKKTINFFFFFQRSNFFLALFLFRHDFEVCTWHTGAFVAGLSLLDARAAVVARRRVAGQVAALAVLPRKLLRAVAPVAANVVDAHAVVLARRGVHVALVDVLLAGFPGEERRAGADEVRLDGGALAAIGTGV